MRNIRIDLKSKVVEFELPQNWDEIPNHLYPSIARLYLRKPEHMNEHDKRVRALAVLLDMHMYLLGELTEHDIMILLPLIDWVYGDIGLSTNKIEKISLDDVDYLGPQFDFSNIRFGEFVMAETYFMHCVESGLLDKMSLCKLASVLYRVKGKGSIYTPGKSDYRGDIRQKFNSNLVDDQATKFMQVDIDVLEGVYLWYAVAREKFFSYFPNVFSKRKSSNANQSTFGPKTFGWLGVFDDLLGEKGRTAETLEDEFVSTTLLSLERTQIRVKEMKVKR